jgi:predicted AAA+ superfamily ATPase
MKSFIKRENYLERIKPFIWKDLVKVFIWQRRVWKSYLLYQIIDFLINKKINQKEIIYINKEDLKWDYIEDYNDLYNEVKNFKYIFIDEIWDIENWEKAIRSLQSKWGYDIYITGSNSNLLSSELATFLSGRYISFNIYPLNYKEFLLFHNLEKSEKTFYKYIEFWGLPYLKNLKLDSEIVSSYLKDVVNTIILKDIISKFKIRNIDFYKKLLQYLAKEVWIIFAAKNISDYLKSQKINISTNVVLDYLSFSKEALFLNEINRFDIKWKKLFEIRQKYFFTDIWLRNVLSWGFTTLDIWGILENIVYINLVSNWWKVTVWEIEKKEIDFIAEKNWKIIYIQVAYILDSQKTKQREFWAYEKVRDNWQKYVITLDKNASGFIDWIEYKNIIDFIYELD